MRLDRLVPARRPVVLPVVDDEHNTDPRQHAAELGFGRVRLDELVREPKMFVGHQEVAGKECGRGGTGGVGRGPARALTLLPGPERARSSRCALQMHCWTGSAIWSSSGEVRTAAPASPPRRVGSAGRRAAAAALPAGRAGAGPNRRMPRPPSQAATRPCSRASGTRRRSRWVALGPNWPRTPGRRTPGRARAHVLRALGVCARAGGGAAQGSTYRIGVVGLRRIVGRCHCRVCQRRGGKDGRGGGWLQRAKSQRRRFAGAAPTASHRSQHACPYPPRAFSTAHRCALHTATAPTRMPVPPTRRCAHGASSIVPAPVLHVLMPVSPQCNSNMDPHAGQVHRVTARILSAQRRILRGEPPHPQAQLGPTAAAGWQHGRRQQQCRERGASGEAAAGQGGHDMGADWGGVSARQGRRPSPAAAAGRRAVVGCAGGPVGPLRGRARGTSLTHPCPHPNDRRPSCQRS
jgi:hypothetical protein